MKQIFIAIVFVGLINDVYSQKEQNMIVYLDADSKSVKANSIAMSVQHTTRLTVVMEENHSEANKIIMPPLSAAVSDISSVYDYEVFIDELPNDFLKLIDLKYLDISLLGLKKLPDLSKFPRLESLDLSYNPINIYDEIQNIAKLKSLKILNIQGCDFNSDDIKQLKQHLSGALIIHRIDQKSADFFPDKPIIGTSEDKLRLALLEDIHKFYPVGLSNLNKASKQFQNYKIILEKSVSGIESEFNNEEWKSLLEKLNSELKDHKVYNNTFINFPSRSLFVPLEPIPKDSTIEKKSIILDISLLTNFYSVYIESIIVFDNYTDNATSLKERIVYGKKNATEYELNLMNRLVEEVSQFYKEYKFIDHQTIMNTKVTGAVPYGEEIETSQREYSIYSLMFSQKPLRNAKIID